MNFLKQDSMNPLNYDEIRIWGLVPFYNQALDKYCLECGNFIVKEIQYSYSATKYILVSSHDNGACKETVVEQPPYFTFYTYGGISCPHVLLVVCDETKHDKFDFCRLIRKTIIRHMKEACRDFSDEPGFSLDTFRAYLMSAIPKIDSYISQHVLPNCSEINTTATLDLYQELVDPMLDNLRKVSTF